jgi:NADH-quinone oxidoreductase subunit L
MTRMGGLYGKMKVTALTMLMGVLAISGIPLFSGWYSKDAVLASAIGFAHLHREHALLFIVPLATAGLTAFYMFRMWLMTFTGGPRDEHVYEHAQESPPLMTGPLVVLALFSVVVAWGAPPWDPVKSKLEETIHHAQPRAVVADFGQSLEAGDEWDGPVTKSYKETERYWAQEYHHFAGNLALLVVALGIVFAFLLYYYRVLDPAQAQEEFPRLHRFLWHKWYFDEVYRVVVVRPVLVIAHWLKAFDLRVIDGAIHAVAGASVWVSKWDGIFDRNVVDGLVNVVGNTTYAVGAGLRRLQTGFLRSYVLFLVLAAVGIFVALAAM